MRREDIERLHAWEAPLALQDAIGEEPAERVERLLEPYDEPLEFRWPHERRIPRTARRRPWWERQGGRRFISGILLVGVGIVLLVQARRANPALAWGGASVLAAIGLLLVALDVRLLARSARWFAITPTRLLVCRGRRLDIYRWEGFAPHVAVFLARGVGCLALEWRGRDGTLAQRVELRGVLDPEPLAQALERRIRRGP